MIIYEKILFANDKVDCMTNDKSDARNSRYVLIRIRNPQ